MKKIITPLRIAAAALVALAGSAAQAQVSVGVGASININVPGVYGRVDIGAPAPGVAVVQPEVVYPQPVIIAPPRVPVQQAPIYLYVPEAYTRDWRHHCAAYHACGQPVYFVREQWVRDRYVQHHPNDHRFDHGPVPVHAPAHAPVPVRGHDGHDDHGHDDHGKGHDDHDDHDHH